jgi:hypothetical protein
MHRKSSPSSSTRSKAISTGEAIVTNDRGLAVFDLIRHKRHGEAIMLDFVNPISGRRGLRRRR